MERIAKEQLPESGKLYAQIENFYSLQDYIPRRPCVRFIGITPVSFTNESFNSQEGCSTFILDISWNDFFWTRAGLRLKKPFSWPYFHNGPNPQVGGGDWDEIPPDLWFVVEYQTVQFPSESYTYAAFADDEPTYLKILSIQFEKGPPVNPIVAALPRVVETHNEGDVTLTAYHVGQGMCSLMAGQTTGFLLDAGAGTPINRENYRAGTQTNGSPLINELRPAALALSSLSAILSHPDGDHWRLLEWDSLILNALKTVYLPSGLPALAFSAPSVKPKVKGLADGSFVLSPKSSIDVFRSVPSRSDRNGECLVVHAKSDGSTALLSGDYVYDRMANDNRKDEAIALLATATFDAVVVPHHGDEASAAVLPWPSKASTSIAYFSAGTHAGFGHPTTASLTAHNDKGFAVVDKHWCKDVLALQLLP